MKVLGLHLAVGIRIRGFPILGVDAKVVKAFIGFKIQNFELNFCSVGDGNGLTHSCVSRILFGIVWCLELSLGSSLDQTRWLDFGPGGKEALPVLQVVAIKPDNHHVPLACERSWKFLPSVYCCRVEQRICSAIC